MRGIFLAFLFLNTNAAFLPSLAFDIVGLSPDTGETPERFKILSPTEPITVAFSRSILNLGATLLHDQISEQARPFDLVDFSTGVPVQFSWRLEFTCPSQVKVLPSFEWPPDSDLHLRLNPALRTFDNMPLSQASRVKYSRIRYKTRKLSWSLYSIFSPLAAQATKRTWSPVTDQAGVPELPPDARLTITLSQNVELNVLASSLILHRSSDQENLEFVMQPCNPVLRSSDLVDCIMISNMTLPSSSSPTLLELLLRRSPATDLTMLLLAPLPFQFAFQFQDPLGPSGRVWALHVRHGLPPEMMTSNFSGVFTLSAGAKVGNVPARAISPVLLHLDAPEFVSPGASVWLSIAETPWLEDGFGRSLQQQQVQFQMAPAQRYQLEPGPLVVLPSDQLLHWTVFLRDPEPWRFALTHLSLSTFRSALELYLFPLPNLAKPPLLLSMTQWIPAEIGADLQEIPLSFGNGVFLDQRCVGDPSQYPLSDYKADFVAQTDLQLSAILEPNFLFLRALYLRNGSAAAGTSVSIFYRSAYVGITEVPLRNGERWLTDSHGTLEVPLADLHPAPVEHCFHVWAEYEDSTAVLPDICSGSIPSSPRFRARVITDRQFYRPGDALFVKLYVRELVGTLWMVPKRDASFRLSVDWVEGEASSRLEFKLSEEYGEFHSELLVPRTATPGARPIELRHENGVLILTETRTVLDALVADGSTIGASLSESLQILVQEEFLIPGSSLALTILATGALLSYPSHVRVNWTLFRTLTDETSLSCVWNKSLEKYSTPCSADQREHSLSLNPQGRAQLMLDLDSLLTKPCQEGDALLVSASWFGPSGQLSEANFKLPVAHSRWQLNLTTSVEDPVPGFPFLVQATVIDVLSGMSVPAVQLRYELFSCSDDLCEDVQLSTLLSACNSKSLNPNDDPEAPLPEFQCAITLPTMGRHLLRVGPIERDRFIGLSCTLLLGRSPESWNRNPLSSLNSLFSIRVHSPYTTKIGDSVVLTVVNAFQNASLLLRWGSVDSRRSLSTVLPWSPSTSWEHNLTLRLGTECLGGCALSAILTIPPQNQLISLDTQSLSAWGVPLDGQIQFQLQESWTALTTSITLPVQEQELQVDLRLESSKGQLLVLCNLTDVDGTSVAGKLALFLVESSFQTLEPDLDHMLFAADRTPLSKSFMLNSAPRTSIADTLRFTVSSAQFERSKADILYQVAKDPWRIPAWVTTPDALQKQGPRTSQATNITFFPHSRVCLENEAFDFGIDGKGMVASYEKWKTRSPHVSLLGDVLVPEKTFGDVHSLQLKLDLPRPAAFHVLALAVDNRNRFGSKRARAILLPAPVEVSSWVPKLCRVGDLMRAIVRLNVSVDNLALLDVDVHLNYDDVRTAALVLVGDDEKEQFSLHMGLNNSGMTELGFRIRAINLGEMQLRIKVRFLGVSDQDATELELHHNIKVAAASRDAVSVSTSVSLEVQTDNHTGLVEFPSGSKWVQAPPVFFPLAVPLSGALRTSVTSGLYAALEGLSHMLLEEGPIVEHAGLWTSRAALFVAFLQQPPTGSLSDQLSPREEVEKMQPRVMSALNSLSTLARGLQLSSSSAFRNEVTNAELNAWALYVAIRLRAVSVPVPPSLVRMWRKALEAELERQVEEERAAGRKFADYDLIALSRMALGIEWMPPTTIWHTDVSTRTLLDHLDLCSIEGKAAIAMAFLQVGDSAYPPEVLDILTQLFSALRPGELEGTMYIADSAARGAATLAAQALGLMALVAGGPLLELDQAGQRLVQQLARYVATGTSDRAGSFFAFDARSIGLAALAISDFLQADMGSAEVSLVVNMTSDFHVVLAGGLSSSEDLLRGITTPWHALASQTASPAPLVMHARGMGTASSSMTLSFVPEFKLAVPIWRNLYVEKIVREINATSERPSHFERGWQQIFTLDSVVQVELLVMTSSPVRDVLLTDLVPPCLLPYDESYPPPREPWSAFAARDSRAGRVWWFASSLPAGSHFVSYRARAVCLGQMRLPASHAFSLPAPEIMGLSSSGWVAIVSTPIPREEHGEFLLAQGISVHHYVYPVGCNSRCTQQAYCNLEIGECQTQCSTDQACQVNLPACDPRFQDCSTKEKKLFEQPEVMWPLVICMIVFVVAGVFLCNRHRSRALRIAVEVASGVAPGVDDEHSFSVPVSDDQSFFARRHEEEQNTELARLDEKAQREHSDASRDSFAGLGNDFDSGSQFASAFRQQNDGTLQTNDSAGRSRTSFQAQREQGKDWEPAFDSDEDPD
eukprot:g60542.t1